MLVRARRVLNLTICAMSIQALNMIPDMPTRYLRQSLTLCLLVGNWQNSIDDHQ